MKKLKELSIVAFLSIVFTACGGGSGGSGGSNGGDDASDNDSTSSVNLSGKVADGYIQDAVVCLDLNDNNYCDPDEPTDTSGEGGEYSIDGVSQTESQEHAIIVKVPEHAIDEDTYQNVGSTYYMGGTQGDHKFVSPLTTIIKNRLDTTPGIKAEELSKALALKFGMNPDTVELLDDYIESNNQRAHRVAQVAARVMGDNHESVEDAAVIQGIAVSDYRAELHRIVVNHATQSLDKIITAVTEAEQTGGKFDPDAVAAEVELADTTNINEMVVQESLNSNQTVSTVRDVLQEGANEFIVENGSYEQIHKVLSDDGSKMVERFSEYDESAGSWSDIQHEGGEIKIHWDHNNGEWREYARNKDLPIEFLDNGRARLTWGPGNYSDIQVTQVSLADKRIESALPDAAYQDLPDLGDARFGTGAKGVRFNMKTAEGSYSLSYVDPSTGCDSHVEMTGNCNAIYGVNGAISSLDQLLLSGEAEADSMEVGNVENTIYLKLQGQYGDSSGKAEFYWQDKDVTYSTLWFRRTLGDNTSVIVVEKPTAILSEMGTTDARYKVFSVMNDYVREGNYVPEGEMSIRPNLWSFNDAAMKDILQAVGVVQQSPFYQ